MNRRPTPLLTFFALLATVMLAVVLVGGFAGRADALRADNQWQLAQLQQQWGREAAASKAVAHEAILKRQRELDQALGGPPEIPFRNPDLTIQQMLDQT